MARSVVGADGRTWRVGRRWFSHRARFRSPRGQEIADIGFDFLGDGWLTGLLVGITVFVLLIFVVIPAVIFAIELALVLLVAAAGVLGRIVFRRPWVVEAAVPGTEHRQAWNVVGWRESGRVIDDVARALQAGTRTLNPEGATRLTTAKEMGVVKWSTPFD